MMYGISMCRLSNNRSLLLIVFLIGYKICADERYWKENAGILLVSYSLLSDTTPMVSVDSEIIQISLKRREISCFDNYLKYLEGAPRTKTTFGVSNTETNGIEEIRLKIDAKGAVCSNKKWSEMLSIVVDPNTDQLKWIATIAIPEFWVPDYEIEKFWQKQITDQGLKLAKIKVQGAQMYDYNDKAVKKLAKGKVISVRTSAIQSKNRKRIPARFAGKFVYAQDSDYISGFIEKSKIESLD